MYTYNVDSFSHNENRTEFFLKINEKVTEDTKINSMIKIDQANNTLCFKSGAYFSLESKDKKALTHYFGNWRVVVGLMLR